MITTIRRFGTAFALVATATAGILLIVLACAEPRQAMAESNSVTFPELDELVHYTNVERGVTLEHMLTNQTALDAIKAGKPVPVGTHVVLQDFQSGKLYRFLVSQKMSDAADSWQYQWFWPDKSIKADENTAQCYQCHRSRIERNFMFTFSDAADFDPTKAVD